MITKQSATVEMADVNGGGLSGTRNTRHTITSLGANGVRYVIRFSEKLK